MRGLGFCLSVLAGSVFLTLLCWHHVLSYGLTDMDTLMHIREGRVEAAGDLLGLFSEKLTGGRAPAGANFYRPTVMWTFAGLRGAFGWEPFGYHAFGLALHALCGALLAAFATSCAGAAGAARPRRLGVACGALFLVHPVGAEIVPAIARNGDLLMTALGLAALLALHAALERGARSWDARSWLALAAVPLLFARSRGAPEPAIVFLGAAFCYAVMVRRDGSALVRARRATLLLAPGLLIFGLYFAARARVLGDALGGYGTPFEPWFATKLVTNQLWVDLTVPGFAFRLGDVIPRFYELPEASAALLVALVSALVTLAAGLLARRAPREPGARLALYGLAVVLLYAALFVATGFYERRFLYPAAAFACFPAAVALLWSADRLVERARERHFDARAAAAAGVLGLALVWGVQTPILHRYDEWRSSGEATRLLTEALRADWARLPEGSRVVVVNMPSGFSLDPMRAVMYLGLSSTNSPAPRALLAWLEEQHPGKRLRVNALGYHRYREPLDAFRHRARVLAGAVEFDTPEAFDDLDEALAARREFRSRRIGERRLALGLRAPKPPPRSFLLVFDGLSPRFVPFSRLVRPTGGLTAPD